MQQNVTVYYFLLQKHSNTPNSDKEHILKTTGIRSAEKNIWKSKQSCTNTVITTNTSRTTPQVGSRFTQSAFLRAMENIICP
jgi:hypothetical protein